MPGIVGATLEDSRDLTPAEHAQFERVAGQSAQALGLKTFGDADRYLRNLQAARTANVTGSSPQQPESSKVGTRNESIYPTR